MKKGVNPQKLILLFFSILLPSLAFSSIVKEEARLYRERGYEAQKIGDYETAFSSYEKAIAVDPNYSIAYNDLGVLYERKGNKSMARAMYQRALEIDPNYKEVYYNLAALHESEGDFLKAAFYWKQRLRFGQPNSRGISEAREHLRQIGQIYPQITEDLKRQDAEFLADEIGAMKRKFENLSSESYIKTDNYDEEAKKLLLEMERQKIR